MLKELISIIVPVYNVEQYIPKCLDSILQQTYTQIEIIVVNDGSTDNSGTVCDHYAQKDSRIKVIHQPNQGVSAARNIGLTHAQGEFIGFIDPDDWISPHMYHSLHTELIARNADMTVCDIYFVTDTCLYLNKKQNSEAIEELSPKEAILSVNNGPCNKLYKRNILPDNPFPIGYFYEDCYIMIDILAKCNKVISINTPFYYYYQRENSTCHTWNAKFLNDHFEATRIKYEKMKIYYPELTAFADQSQILSDLGICYLIACKKFYDPEVEKLSLYLQQSLTQYPLLRLCNYLPWRHWPAALLLKYIPTGFKSYAIVKHKVRNILFGENDFNSFNFHKIPRQS